MHAQVKCVQIWRLRSMMDEKDCARVCVCAAAMCVAFTKNLKKKIQIIFYEFLVFLFNFKYFEVCVRVCVYVIVVISVDIFYFV